MVSICKCLYIFSIYRKHSTLDRFIVFKYGRQKESVTRFIGYKIQFINSFHDLTPNVRTYIANCLWCCHFHIFVTINLYFNEKTFHNLWFLCKWEGLDPFFKIILHKIPQIKNINMCIAIYMIYRRAKKKNLQYFI